MVKGIIQQKVLKKGGGKEKIKKATDKERDNITKRPGNKEKRKKRTKRKKESRGRGREGEGKKKRREEI